MAWQRNGPTDTKHIVMVPGLGSDAAVWERTIEALGPGYECQVGDTLSDDSLTGMAERVLASAPERFALAGVSMGGMVAMTIMTLAPERLTHLALFDTNARSDTPDHVVRRRSTNSAMLATNDLRGLAEPGIGYMVHPQTSQDVRDALATITVRVGATAYVCQNEAVLARDDFLPILAGIDVPTIVVVGADDFPTPVAFSQEIADSIPRAELHVIPECGHLPPIKKPAATASLIRGLVSVDFGKGGDSS